MVMLPLESDALPYNFKYHKFVTKSIVEDAIESCLYNASFNSRGDISTYC